MTKVIETTWSLNTPVVNVGDRDLKDLYVGMYADWDVRNAAENQWRDAYTASVLGFVYSASDVPYAGGIVQLNFANLPFYSFMIDNAQSDNGKRQLTR